MARYRGKLIDSTRSVKGIHTTLYSQTGAKIDTTVTDKYGFYQFNNLKNGTYDVKFWGGGYNENDTVTITVTEQGSNIQYVIAPLDGTALRDGNGSLRVQLQVSDPSGISPVTEGPVKLCLLNNNNYVPLDSPYEKQFSADEINPSLTVFAVADPGSEKQFIYDSITLVDITDGIGWVGWVETNSLIALKNEDNTISPETITVIPKWAVDGTILPEDPTTDSNFSWESFPPENTAEGISVNSNTGVVTLNTNTCFNSQDFITLTWVAKYTYRGKTQTYSVSETIVKAVNGSSAKNLSIQATALIFKKPKDSNVLTPEYITLVAKKSNITGQVNWICDADLYSSPNGTVTTTGDTVYLKNSDFVTESLGITAQVTDTVTGSLFTDFVTVLKVQEGSDSITASLTNESHSIPVNEDGVAVYTDSGTTISVWEGSQQLQYTQNANPANGEFKVTFTGTNITVGVPSKIDNNAVFSDHSNMTEDIASVTYLITGKRLDGTEFSTITKTQTLQKNHAGQSAWSLDINPKSIQVSKRPDNSYLPFSETVTGSVFRGSLDKTADYKITNITVTNESGDPLNINVIGLSQNNFETTGFTINQLNTDYAKVTIQYSTKPDKQGPVLTGSLILSKIEAGSQGPGILYIGQLSDLSPNRPLNNNNNARDVVSYNGDYYAFVGADSTTVGNASSIPGSDWEIFESFSAIATGMLIAEESYIKHTVNIGTNSVGDSSNIVLYGNNTNPYISIGQVIKNYNQTGIYLGIDSGTAKFSLKSNSGENSLIWDGENLKVTGEITALSGKIGNFNINTGIYSGRESFSSLNSGVYIGTDGIALGDSGTAKFSVTNEGDLYSEKGVLAGWNVNPNKLSKGIVELSSTSNSEGLIVLDPVDNSIQRIKIGNFNVFDLVGSQTNLVTTDSLSYTYYLGSEYYKPTTPTSGYPPRPAVDLSQGLDNIVTTLDINGWGDPAQYSNWLKLEVNIGTLANNQTLAVSFRYKADYGYDTYYEIHTEMVYSGGTFPEFELNRYNYNFISNVFERSFYNNTGVNITNIKFNIWIKLGGAAYSPDAVLKIQNLKVFKLSAFSQITPIQTIFYSSPQNYFQWTPEKVELKSNNFTVSTIETGDLLVRGDTVFLGNVTVEGNLASHPYINAASSVNNSLGTVIQDLTFDTFGHVTNVQSVDLDQRFVQLTKDSQTITGDVTITGNVYIQGGSTLIDSQISTADTVILLNSGETGAGVTAGFSGFQVSRGSLTDYVIGFRESDKQLVLGEYVESQVPGVPNPENLQALATRQNSPVNTGIPWYNSTAYRFDTTSGFKFDGNNLHLPAQANSSTHAVRADRTLTISTSNGITGGGSPMDLTQNRSWSLGLTGQALALHNLNINGLITRTGSGLITSRTIQGTSNQIIVTHGDGVNGNPVLSLPQDIHSGASPVFAGLTVNGQLNIDNLRLDGNTISAINTNGEIILDANFGVNIKAGASNEHELELSSPGGHTGIIFNRNGLANRSRFNLVNYSNIAENLRYFQLAYDSDGVAGGLNIQKGGKVGINTNSPYSTLTVNGYGSNQIDRNLGISESQYAGIAFWNPLTGGSSNYRAMTFYVTGWDGSNVTVYDVLHIMGGAQIPKVGIYNTNPQKTLDITGNFRATESIESGLLTIDNIKIDGNQIFTTGGGIDLDPASYLVKIGANNVGNVNGRRNALRLYSYDNNALAYFQFQSAYLDGRRTGYLSGSNMQQIRLDSNIIQIQGSVGINLTTPNYALDVNGTIRSLKGGNTNYNITQADEDISLILGTSGTDERGYIKLWGNTPGAYGIIQMTTANLHLDSYTTGKTYINYYSATDTIINPNNGNVGIGTTNTAGYKLCVVGNQRISVDSNSAYNLLELRNFSGGTLAYSELVIGNNTTLDVMTIGVGSSNNYAHPNRAYIVQRLNYPLFLATNSTSRIWITGDGKVGINTTSPTQSLEVNGSAIVKSSNAYLQVHSSGGTVKTMIQSSDSLYGIVGTFTNHPLTFRVNNSEKLRILTNGNVGINTGSPFYKLHVNNSVNNLGTVAYVSNTGDVRTHQTLVVDSVFDRDSGYGIWRQGNAKWNLWNDASLTGNNKDRFIISGAGGMNDTKMVILQNGFIGFGVNEPLYKIDISGKLRTNDSVIIKNSVYTTQETQGIATGQTTVASVDSNLYKAAFFDYVLYSGTTQRAGTVIISWNGTDVIMNEYSTNDHGTDDTQDVTFTASQSGSSINLIANIVTGTWNIKVIIRAV